MSVKNAPRNFTLVPDMPNLFIKMNEEKEWPGIRERCTMEYLKKGLSQFPEFEVVSIELNDTGSYLEEGPGHTPEENLPAYYTVRLKQKMQGSHFANITVFLPLSWNGRFYGVTGGGSATFCDYQQHHFAYTTPWTVAIKNHFACAQTDCDIAFTDMTWGFKSGSNEIDWDLMHAWGYEATHQMAAAGKKTVELVYGKGPAFSYLQGTSAGGRTALGEAQRYPGDYDGIWANCPAIPWVMHLLNQTWPYFVMNNEKHPIAKAKVEAFYNGMLKKYGCEEKGYLTACLFPEFDPYTMVGTWTAAGPITEEDARVAEKIYAGPSYSSGKRMYEMDTMGVNIRFAEMLITYSEDGERPLGNIADTALQAFRWMLRKPCKKLEDITYEDIDRIYDAARGEFAGFNNDDPDLRDFRDLGHKLLLTHASSDFCCSIGTTIKYYNNVVRFTAGSEEEASDFIRLYTSKGAGHANLFGVGELMAYPDAFSALVRWVEDGEKPGRLPTQKWNFEKSSPEYSGNSEEPYSLTNPENSKVMR